MFVLPLLPIPRTAHLAVPMSQPTYWLERDGRAVEAITVADELAARRRLARRIQPWEYEQVTIAREIEIHDGPQVFRGLPTPAGT
jgi:hypothetical protein